MSIALAAHSTLSIPNSMSQITPPTTTMESGSSPKSTILPECGTDIVPLRRMIVSEGGCWLELWLFLIIRPRCNRLALVILHRCPC